jgi:peptide-methionine (R)-S-oxide reductase
MFMQDRLRALTTVPGQPRRDFLLQTTGLWTVAGLVTMTHAANLSGPRRSETVLIDNFSASGKSQGSAELPRAAKSDVEWRRQLSGLAYQVTRQEGTEPPLSGKYASNHADGLYRRICCDTALFDSKTKFESATGWPSFWQPISRTNVVEAVDYKLTMHRTAISCARCDAHLGHVFNDGPRPTGLRYCMNWVALSFVARA